MIEDTCSTNTGILNIISEVEPSCFTWPFNYRTQKCMAEWRGRGTTGHRFPNTTNGPRADAGRKGAPAKEFRQKLMMTGISDMPSSPDRRILTSRIREYNQGQAPSETNPLCCRVVEKDERCRRDGQDGQG